MPRDIGASVRQRLLNLARERQEAFDYVLNRFVVERLLFRLGESRHRDSFVLKGATLFTIWSNTTHRATRDLDLMGHGDPAPSRLVEAFGEICRVGAESDGLAFDADAIEAEAIREAQRYGGVRLRIPATLAGARVRLQVDVGFGDALIPPAREVEFPCLLDLPAPRVRAYPSETVVAEKLEAMVALGPLNSRMKDFYDLWILSREMGFDGETLCAAIRGTFERRGTPLPSEAPVALSAPFHEDRQKQEQWRGFLNRSGAQEISLADVVTALRQFLLSPLDALAQSRSFNQSWMAGGPWRAVDDSDLAGEAA